MFANSNIRRINNPKTFLPATSFKYSDNDMNSYPAYEGMFFWCPSLENAPEIHLAYIGRRDCAAMFYYCTSLTTAAAINSLTVGNHGCNTMYYGCVNLVEAQDILPMFISGASCYYSMFALCSSLKKAPVLPQEILRISCYSQMFYKCSSLNYIKAMTTTPLDGSYSKEWVNGVASTGTFIKNKNATWNNTGVSGIPSGWTVISE